MTRSALFVNLQGPFRHHTDFPELCGFFLAFIVKEQTNRYFQKMLIGCLMSLSLDVIYVLFSLQF